MQIESDKNALDLSDLDLSGAKSNYFNIVLSSSLYLAHHRGRNDVSTDSPDAEINARKQAGGHG